LTLGIKIIWSRPIKKSTGEPGFYIIKYAVDNTQLPLKSV